MAKNGKISKKDEKISNFLCFALYSANHAMQRATRPAFDSIGLTYPQYLVLVALWEKDGLLVNEIGKTLFLESNTLTPLIKKLEGLGYVKRERDDKDERKVKVSLTHEGKALQKKTTSFFSGVMELSGLSDEAFKALQKDIVALRNALQENSRKRA